MTGLTDVIISELMYEALCNSLNEFAYAGLQLEISRDDYNKARSILLEDEPKKIVSIELVYTQHIVENGIQVIDTENECYACDISWSEIMDNSKKLIRSDVKMMKDGTGDSLTAFNIIQTLFFGEVVYG